MVSILDLVSKAYWQNYSLRECPVKVTDTVVGNDAADPQLVSVENRLEMAAGIAFVVHVDVPWQVNDV